MTKLKQSKFSSCLKIGTFLPTVNIILHLVAHLNSIPTSGVCETGELVFPGSEEELSDGPCKGDLGLQWRTGVGEGVRPSVRMFCAMLGWM